MNLKIRECYQRIAEKEEDHSFENVKQETLKIV
jgi:hypothetical protein